MSPGPRPASIPCGILILIHPAVWPQQIWVKNSGLCPFWGEAVESPSNTTWPRPTSVPSFIFSIQPFGHNTPMLQIGQTGNGPIAPLGEGGGSPSNTHNVAWTEAYLHAKFHYDPSSCLATIHQRYRQTGQRQWSDSMGRTVLQMVARQ